MSDKAKIEQKAAEWLKAKGYDRKTWKDVASIIASFIDDNPLNPWIAVEDKLPKEMEWVLAYDAIGKQVRYMRRIDQLSWQMGAHAIKDVTHWMPLPEPPHN